MAKLVTSKRGSVRSPKTEQSVQEQIQRLAYQFFVERGYQHGHHAEDWLRAEAKLRRSI